MEREDISAILIYAGGGAACGVVVAVLLRHAKRPFLSTAIGSLVIAPGLALVVVAFFGAVESVRRFGFEPRRAILAGFATSMFLMLSLPIVCGIPALFAGLVTQCALRFGTSPK